ncbi:MAG: gamma-glutamylcyclotransferase family protein [Marinobacter sp.]|uniref:gamma-glutamylcyclotransferase family protein n=1 Tax=Marinobacter sp. TaxID=50741 RepID=UPI00299E1D9F|nr:gamma-glutamylcyclotransferase family protein [Marinobacter sp.]MDX1757226.1 gamma-glutamylcyclotransferase family protein [Marinobacter sp.]
MGGAGDTLVAVYGTLKQGEGNHRWLAGSPRLARCLLRGITLYDLGPYPGARLEPSEGVEVEIYRVSPETLQQLDRLEDYRPANPAAGEYGRVQLETPVGLAWVYIYNGAINDLRAIRRGGWRRA